VENIDVGTEHIIPIRSLLPLSVLSEDLCQVPPMVDSRSISIIFFIYNWYIICTSQQLNFSIIKALCVHMNNLKELKVIDESLNEHFRGEFMLAVC